MLATKLTRAQLEFHAHRVWLRSFNLRKSPSIALNNSIQIRQASSRRNKGTNIPSHDRRNLQNRQTDPHSKYQNDASDMYAKRPARHKKALTEEETEEEALVQSQRALREASIQGDLDNAILCYRSIKEKKLIIEPVLTSFTEALLNYKRSWQTTRESKEDRPEDPQLSDQLENIIAELVRDFRRGALEPCYVAWGHILKYFTIANDSDAAMAFWKWVEAQDDHHLNASIYGIAIELLAAQDAPLEELEALYQKALSRFPAGFPAYHYSSDAVLQDRERAISYRLKSNLSEELLVGIMRGRFMRGDSQNAYLALDSALRLRPIGAQKQFTATIQRERPVVESYTVFAMACKSGIPPSSTSFREILASLRQNADTADAQKFVWTVRAMLSATYLFGSSGGRISRNSLTEVIITLINLITIQGIRAVPHQEQAQLVDAVANLTRRTIAIGARFGVLPTIAAFNTTINRLGCFGRTEEIATRAIEEARGFGLVPTEVTWRSVLAAAGEAGDQELIPRAWERLVQERSASNTSPDSTDLHLLVNVCISSKCTEVARPIIDQMSQLDSFQKDRLLSRLQVKKNEAPEGQPADVTSLLAEFAKINEDLDVLDEKTRDGVAADFAVHQPPMLLFSPPKDVRLPEAEMRKLYDELSVDKSSPKKDPSTLPPPDVSRITKIPFAELRYESWKFITYLIAEAERHDSEYIQSVDQAISRGERPPPRSFGELFPGQDRLVNVGLSDPPQEIVAEGEEVDVEKVRARIMQLRRVELPQPEATESK